MGKFKKFMKAFVEDAEKINQKNNYNKAKKEQAKAVKKNRVPLKCPKCGEKEGWDLVATDKKGFSVGKAAIGGVLFGPVGVAGGALGKKKKIYACQSCGFAHEYDK